MQSSRDSRGGHAPVRPILVCATVFLTIAGGGRYAQAPPLTQCETLSPIISLVLDNTSSTEISSPIVSLGSANWFRRK